MLKEEQWVSGVKPEKGKMKDALGLKPEDEVWKAGDPNAAAEKLIKKFGRKKASGMINFAANLVKDENSKSGKFLKSMQSHLSSTSAKEEEIMKEYKNIMCEGTGFSVADCVCEDCKCMKADACDDEDSGKRRRKNTEMEFSGKRKEEVDDVDVPDMDDEELKAKFAKCAKKADMDQIGDEEMEEMRNIYVNLRMRPHLNEMQELMLESVVAFAGLYESPTSKPFTFSSVKKVPKGIVDIETTKLDAKEILDNAGVPYSKIRKATFNRSNSEITITYDTAPNKKGEVDNGWFQISPEVNTSGTNITIVWKGKMVK